MLKLLLLVSCLLVAVAVQIFWFSPISPVPFEFFPSSSSLWPANNHLQRGIKVGEGYLKEPEDVCFDDEGVLYTATSDGWIKKIHRNGTIQDWKMLHSNSLLGITITKENHLIVCDANNGVLKVNEDGVTLVTSHVNNGSKLRFPDDVIAASDGTLYFSEASTKFSYHNWRLDYLEGKPHGQLLKYDPFLDETSIVLDNLYLANGVALSRDEDYIVVCETFRYRCIKHWLKGERKGTTEIFVDKLPGGPDNINLAPDGSFWIALLQPTYPVTEFLLHNMGFRHLLATFPKLSSELIPAYKKASVINVAADGQIIRKFDDPDGKVVSFITTAYEFEDHLYLGSLHSNFILKLPLKE